MKRIFYRFTAFIAVVLISGMIFSETSEERTIRRMKLAGEYAEVLCTWDSGYIQHECLIIYVDDDGYGGFIYDPYPILFYEEDTHYVIDEVIITP